jgi:hypothetical protein
MSRLDDVLERTIDGYLSYDLSTMERDDESGNGVGFPLLMCTCSGIEFLGGLLSPTQFKAYQMGHSYFNAYWSRVLYPPPSPRAELGGLTYSLVRHGLAHTFTLKGRIGVLRKSPDVHFVRDQNGLLIIDAVQLAHDFIDSYHLRFKQLLASGTAEFRLAMETRLAEMEATFADQALALDAALAKAPIRTDLVTVAASPAQVIGASRSAQGGNRAG